MPVAVPQLAPATEDRAAGIVIPASVKLDRSKKENLYKNTGAGSSDGNKQTWTFSGWVRRVHYGDGSNNHSHQIFFSHGSGSNGEGFIGFNGTGSKDSLYFGNDGHMSFVNTSRKFRDFSGWYHIVWAMDTTQGSNDNRCKIYVNGELLPASEYSSPSITQNSNGYIQRYSDENIDVCLGDRQRGHHNGSNGNFKAPFGGYISHFNFVDGLQVAADQFGYTDDMTGVWRPKKYTGSYGTNGYYLPLDGDSPLGWDHSGKGNNFTPRGIGTVALSKATGAIPILDTSTSGHAATFSGGSGSGVRGDFGTKTVTVASSKFVIDGVSQASLELYRGGTYKFDQSHTSNTNHPLRFSTTDNGSHGGGSEYTDGRVTNGTPGSAGAYTTITVPHNAPDTLYYYCTAHSGMGGNASVTTDIHKADPYAWKCILALPLNKDKRDVSGILNCTTTSQTTTSAEILSNHHFANYYGTACEFDGSSGDYVRISGLNANSDFHFQSGDYTIEAWVFRNEPKAGNDPEVVLNMSNGSSSSSNGVWFLRNYANHWEFAFYNSSTQYKTFTDQYEAGFDRWTHLAVTKSGNNYKLYVNGSVHASATHTQTPNNNASSQLNVGNLFDAAGDEWGGNIQDVRIYKGVVKYTSDFLPGATQPTCGPDTPSGISYRVQYEKQTRSVSTGSVAFDGDSGMRTASHADYALGSGDFTLEFWCYPTTTSGFKAIVSDNLYGSGPASWCCYMNGSEARVAKTNNSFLTSAAGVLEIRSWNHFCWERTGSSNVLYVNGISVATASNSDNFANDRICIGASNFGGNWPGYQFHGNVSNVRLVKGSNVYGAAFKPPTEPLTNITNTKFLACQSTSNALALTVGSSALAYDYGRPNTGEMFSTTGSNSPSSSAANNWKMFDGGRTEFFAGASTSGWSTYTFAGSGIPFTKLRIAASNYNGWSAKVNGTTFTNWGTTFNPAPWHDITSSVSSPLTSVATNSNGSQTATINAIEIDDQILLDGKAWNINSPTATTMNPFDIDKSSESPPSAYSIFNVAASEQNTDAVRDGGLFAYYSDGNDNDAAATTIPMYSGKYYAEFSSHTWHTCEMVGVVYEPYSTKFVSEACWPGKDGNSGIGFQASGRVVYRNGTNIGPPAGGKTSNGPTDGSTIMLALDVDAKKVAFGIDGVWSNGTVEGSMMEISGNFNEEPPYMFAVGDSSGSASVSITANFGQKPYFFTPPSGYQPVSASGQPKSGVANPKDYFKPYTYSGNGGTKIISDLGFQPDLVWVKCRNASHNHDLYDSVRGAGKRLIPNNNDSESSYGNLIQSFDGSGWTMGNSNEINSSNNFIAWCWKAGGNKGTWNVNGEDRGSAAAAGLTTGDTSVLTKCSINTKAGFSIVFWTQDSGGAGKNIAHGLTKAPDFILMRHVNSGSDWFVHHNGISVATKCIFLNDNSGETTQSDFGNALPGATHTATSTTGVNGRTVIMYSWHDVPGFQKFGCFEGNGDADGVYVALGFKPAFIMYKENADNQPWKFVDIKRSGGNPSNLRIENSNGQEDSNAAYNMDFLSNGFKMRNDNSENNQDGQKYLYAAWADSSMNLYGAQPNAH